MLTTAGKIIANDALPEDMRDHSRVLTKGETDKLLARLAKEDPDSYRAVSQKLVNAGRAAAYEEGVTIRLSDLRPQIDKKPAIAAVKVAEHRIMTDKRLTPEEREDARDDLYSKAYGEIRDATMKAAIASGNPFALQVVSKARGNPDQLAALLTTPGTYQDAGGKTFPMFIDRSYAEGLLPQQYWASTYGARTGIVSTKLGTRSGGYLGKLLDAASIGTVVTEEDCGTANGIPEPVDDGDNIGSVMARDAGPYKAGTLVTKEVIAKLNDSGVKNFALRSPISCAARDGVCARCTGIRESGDFPPVGYHLGINTASPVKAAVAQQSLNVKHSGKKSKGLTEHSGFEYIKNMVTVPSTFPGVVALAEEDGTVESVEPAPQGGTTVRVGGRDYHVAADTEPSVKPGDKVEAGDALADGLINPADAVRLRGVGEGRRYFADRYTKILRDSGLTVNRRNIEAIARSVIDNVEVTEPGDGGELPGDVMRYGAWARSFRPRAEASRTALSASAGRYLEEPALHYTIGTRVTKNVSKELGAFGVRDVLTHAKPPPIAPIMESVVESPAHGSDWMARLGTSYLKTRLLDDVRKGSTSDVHGTNPGPGLAKGTEFGKYKGPGFAF